MSSSKVFIAGFRNFEIVYLPGSNEVVSRFQSESQLAAKSVEPSLPVDTLDAEADGKGF